ncbi:MAG: helix-turn-helix domain-containing protein [Longimonas sp.]|uniref:response regulator transcription factor n=1 Tax=Longimonas sp. TaxID=2039626 RepID=UPI003346515F
MMPGMDGLALCQAIKNHPDIDQIPVVFLTALDDSDSRVQGYEVGGDAYLTKPFNGEELEALIENLVRARQSMRDDPNNASRNTRSGHALLERAPLPFGEQLESIIEAHLSDPDFGVAELADAMAMSPSQLRRQMDELYEHSPVQLIRYRRLEAGATLLKKRPDATIGEVAYAVGFNSQSYFSRSFKKAFGVSPSVFRKRYSDEADVS